MIISEGEDKMEVQMIDLENIEAQLIQKFERYQKRYKVTHADLAWILLRLGNSFYFKDICSRGFNENSLFNGNGGR